jgi:diaminohydroxyphosphoribosylaminopyrimidine deaminase/5-amino-6-(5-phosphoribosylamino)uracil reductase
LVYRKKPLRTVLRDLGRKNVTSVLIEGGGEVLGQALAEQLIDKVQIYVGPLFAGGPTIAFPGLGADCTQSAARLERVRYERVDQSVCAIGYPITSKLLPNNFEKLCISH